MHGVGGFLGIVLLGLFADQRFNPDGSNGLFYGDSSFFFKQLAAVLFSSVMGVRFYVWHVEGDQYLHTCEG